MTVTRLGLTGTPTRLYGSFAGKGAVVTIDPLAFIVAVQARARTVEVESRPRTVTVGARGETL